MFCYFLLFFLSEQAVGGTTGHTALTGGCRARGLRGPLPSEPRRCGAKMMLQSPLTPTTQGKPSKSLAKPQKPSKNLAISKKNLQKTAKRKENLGTN